MAPNPTPDFPWSEQKVRWNTNKVGLDEMPRSSLARLARRSLGTETSQAAQGFWLATNNEQAELAREPPRELNEPCSSVNPPDTSPISAYKQNPTHSPITFLAPPPTQRRPHDPSRNSPHTLTDARLSYPIRSSALTMTRTSLLCCAPPTSRQWCCSSPPLP